MSNDVGVTCRINIKSNKIKRIEKSIIIDSITIDSTAIFTDNFMFENNDIVLDYYIIDFNTSENFSPKKILVGYYTHFIIDEDLICFDSNKKTLLKFNQNGTELWQYSLSQLSIYTTDEGEEKPAELVSILGVYTNILWLLVTDRRIIGLDIETGTLCHEIHLCEVLNLKSQTVENYSFSLGDTHLDEEEGKIKGFAHRYYWELDLNNLQAEIKVDFGVGNTWRIKRSKFYQGDKNLYFTGARSGETFDRAIGIFDTETLEIIWNDEPLGDGRYLFFTDIQANDKLLGALDSEQNLRIYERD